MKKIIPVSFIIAAAVLAFFLVGKNLFVKDVSITRARVVNPIVGENETAEEVKADEYEDFEETSFIELANDETLLSIVTMDIDGDGFDDQINIVKTSSGPYIVLIVGLYEPATSSYVRSAYLATNITQIRTFACTGLDVIGNHKNSLVYQGITNNGHSVLRIFNGSRSRSGEFVLTMIGNFESDGTVFIQQSQRSEAYELGQTNGESFPVWVYASASQEDSAQLDQIQTMYDWNEKEGEYTEVRQVRVPGSRIAATELAKIQDGTVATFANFLNGLWYKTVNSSNSIRYIFFDYANQEVIFQFEDSEEVYSWLNSTLRRNGIYFSSVNQSVETLQRRFDISLVNIDEIRVRIQDDVRMVISETSQWDGNYKKVTANTLKRKEAPKSSLCIDSLVTGPAWTTSDGTYFVFTKDSFTVENEQFTDSGSFAVTDISNEKIIQFKNDGTSQYFSGYYIPSFSQTTETTTDRRGRRVTQTVEDKDVIILQKVTVSPDGFFHSETRPVLLRRTELRTQNVE